MMFFGFVNSLHTNLKVALEKEVDSLIKILDLTITKIKSELLSVQTIINSNITMPYD